MSRRRRDPRTATAVANLVRTWLECGAAETDSQLEEIAETNEILLKLLQQRGVDIKGGGGRPN